MTRGSTIKASKVGSGPSATETVAREPAPRREDIYRCERQDCALSPFTVPFAAEVTPPATWHCRCGQTARLDGAPDDAPEVPLPGYTSAAEQHQSTKREKTDPWSQLMKRRTIAELEALVEERRAQLRGGAA